jgi:hypothetical protein
MMRFQTKQEATAAGISIVAIIILAASLVWMLTPVPSRNDVNSGRLGQVRRYQAETAGLIKQAAEAQAKIDPLLWSGTSEEIGPKALASVTKLAKARKIRILAFRPQKPIDMGGLTQIPFSLSIDGTYPNTMQLVKDLETTDAKLAVSLVQVAASDGATDQVTASINVVAYVKTAPPAKTSGGSRAQKS